MMWPSVLALTGAALGLLSCATSQPATTGEPATQTAARPAWADMTPEQKGQVMKDVVMPRARELFSTYNPQKFADVKCSLCHGPNPKERAFKMPSPDLPEFEPSMFEDHPDMSMFMKNQVMPMVAEAMGLRPFDGQSGDVRCTTCHPKL